MLPLGSLDYSSAQWIILCLCGTLVGISKTGLPGLGTMLVVLLALTFPAEESTGLMLLMLAFADIFAVAYYRRHAKWSYIPKLLPWALLGIATGSVAIRILTDAHLGPIIGVIILVLLTLNLWWRPKNIGSSALPKHWIFAGVMGFLAGLTTQLANAAGPILIIYLLAVGLPKYEFIGTRAWYALILNWIKIPIFISEGRITFDTLKTGAAAVPLVALGAVVGILIIKRIPQKSFEIVIQILAVLAGLKLVASAL